MLTPKKIRVGHVTLGLDIGGQEKLLVEFARHRDRERFELVFISLSPLGSLAPQLKQLGCQVLSLDQPPGLKPKLIFRLRRLFKEQHLDIVHSHDDNPLLYCALATKFAGLRSYLHTHHHGKLAHFSRRQEWLVGLAARLTNRFVCVSRDSARQMENQGVPARKIEVVWNGIDLDEFAYHGPDPLGPIVTVGRLSPEKDQATLLHAAKLITDQDPTFRLEIAGDGPCREALEKQIRELGLEAYVRLLGPVKEIADLLGRASLFVLPSTSEGISLTLLEAMARGLPLVATRVGGNPEVVTDGETGTLVPARDPGALARAIQEIRTQPELGRRLGFAGRQRVENHFDIRQMVASYEELYMKPFVDISESVPALMGEIVDPRSMP